MTLEASTTAAFKEGKKGKKNSPFDFLLLRETDAAEMGGAS